MKFSFASVSHVDVPATQTQAESDDRRKGGVVRAAEQMARFQRGGKHVGKVENIPEETKFGQRKSKSRPEETAERRNCCVSFVKSERKTDLPTSEFKFDYFHFDKEREKGFPSALFTQESIN
ncbi:hypothetical protein RUM43_002427 [Polyplax serrata]|uniref:Uncharacterized protein n=1 Tax=Polyplax serrata TaxID=468196 RepID=A0AAN8S4R3_POLSC